MEVKTIEEDKNVLDIEIYGSDITMCELLRKKLSDDPSVKIATYSVIHPLLDGIEMRIETNKGSPSSALETAVKDVQKDIADFKKQF